MFFAYYWPIVFLRKVSNINWLKKFSIYCVLLRLLWWNTGFDFVTKSRSKSSNIKEDNSIGLYLNKNWISHHRPLFVDEHWRVGTLGRIIRLLYYTPIGLCILEVFAQGKYRSHKILKVSILITTFIIFMVGNRLNAKKTEWFSLHALKWGSTKLSCLLNTPSHIFLVLHFKTLCP